MLPLQHRAPRRARMSQTYCAHVAGRSLFGREAAAVPRISDEEGANRPDALRPTWGLQHLAVEHVRRRVEQLSRCLPALGARRGRRQGRDRSRLRVTSVGTVSAGWGRGGCLRVPAPGCAVAGAESRFSCAWIRVVSGSLLPFTDAGAPRTPIARRRAHAARLTRARGSATTNTPARRAHSRNELISAMPEPRLPLVVQSGRARKSA